MKHTYLIAPSNRISQETVEKTKECYESLGRKVTVPSDLFGKDLLCANTDAARAKHLTDALTSQADEMMMLIGGYGLTRLIPMLLDLPKPEKQKIMYGFSDATALHIFLNQLWDWPSVHGPSGAQLSMKTVDTDSIDRTLRILEEGLAAYILPDIIPLNAIAKERTNVSGKIVGGNLTLVQTSLGTPWQLDLSDKILFLEDVSERGYRIDRMLTHLRQAQFFKGVKAVLLGDFVKGEEPNGTNLVWDVLKRFAEESSFPVFKLPGCGHGPQNYPIPFNYEVNLRVQD
ncbi:MAG: LD-carboxypeptidase [Alphaproteobacteria bacterium]|jgi:muramoyltetrapeptide carboxypeptidase|nr:LD-carboxypeptidase [Alphaproteobacteria bacterium]